MKNIISRLELKGGSGGNCPTQTLVDAYEMKSTGKLWNEEGSGYSEADPYADRDPRFALTIAKNGDTKWPAYNAGALQIYYGGSNAEPLSGATPTGYYLRKYCDGSIDLRAGSFKYEISHMDYFPFRRILFELSGRLSLTIREVWKYHFLVIRAR